MPIKDTTGYFTKVWNYTKVLLGSNMKQIAHLSAITLSPWTNLLHWRPKILCFNTVTPFCSHLKTKTITQQFHKHAFPVSNRTGQDKSKFTESISINWMRIIAWIIKGVFQFPSIKMIELWNLNINRLSEQYQLCRAMW